LRYIMCLLLFFQTKKTGDCDLVYLFHARMLKIADNKNSLLPQGAYYGKTTKKNNITLSTVSSVGNHRKVSRFLTNAGLSSSIGFHLPLPKYCNLKVTKLGLPRKRKRTIIITLNFH